MGNGIALLLGKRIWMRSLIAQLDLTTWISLTTMTNFEQRLSSSYAQTQSRGTRATCGTGFHVPGETLPPGILVAHSFLRKWTEATIAMRLWSFCWSDHLIRCPSATERRQIFSSFSSTLREGNRGFPALLSLWGCSKCLYVREGQLHPENVK